MANLNNFQEQLDILSATKTSIKEAIIGKGQEVSSEDSFSSYANKIDGIVTLDEGTADANANADDILLDKTAYVNGQKITGSITGSTANPVTAGSHPTISDDGSNINVDRGYGKKFILNADQQLRSSISYSDMANLINLTADKIKSGVTILGITGTYSDAMKEYASETAMNNDIANIQEGEVVKVVASGTTTYYIKETTMKKLVKEEDTISPQEYEENVNLADDILGTE